MKTDEEIKELALKAYRGEVFTSDQVGESEVDILSIIFMPLTFMDDATREKLVQDKVTMFYGDTSKALPSSVNGYPVLPEMGYLNIEEHKKFRAKMAEIVAAMKKV